MLLGQAVHRHGCDVQGCLPEPRLVHNIPEQAETPVIHLHFLCVSHMYQRGCLHWFQQEGSHFWATQMVNFSRGMEMVCRFSSWVFCEILSHSGIWVGWPQEVGSAGGSWPPHPSPAAQSPTGWCSSCSPYCPGEAIHHCWCPAFKNGHWCPGDLKWHLHSSISPVPSARTSSKTEIKKARGLFPTPALPSIFPPLLRQRAHHTPWAAGASNSKRWNSWILPQSVTPAQAFGGSR